MEGHCSTGQSPHWAVVPMEEEEAIYTKPAPVRGHLYTMGLFDGDPICRVCGMETKTVQHIICCCEAMALSLGG